MTACQSPFGGGAEKNVAGTGSLTLSLLVEATTPDATVLHTIEAGHRYQVLDAYYDVQTAFSGGTNSAIGIKSSAAPHNAAGDLVGGATGDLAASLGVGLGKGTPGTDYGSSGRVFLNGGDQIIFNRIASAFTAGKAYLKVVLVEIGT